MHTKKIDLRKHALRALTNMHNKQVDKVFEAQELEKRAGYFMLAAVVVSITSVFVDTPGWLDACIAILSWGTFIMFLWRIMEFKGLVYTQMQLSKHILDAADITTVIEIGCNCDEQDKPVDAVKKPAAKKAEATKENGKD